MNHVLTYYIQNRQVLKQRLRTNSRTHAKSLLIESVEEIIYVYALKMKHSSQKNYQLRTDKKLPPHPLRLLVLIGNTKETKRGDDILIDADKARIHQVISNLLKNAVKVVMDDETITITLDVNTKSAERGLEQRQGQGQEVGEEEEVVVVKVKDTGTGTDPLILPRLFTKFATSSSEAIGLGLYTSENNISSWWQNMGRE